MDDYTSMAVNAGLDPSLAAYMPRYIQIESGGNPNARTGSYSGLLQMGPSEASRYGGYGAANGAAMYADRAKWFQNKFGRAPSPTELYLANQQGQGGIAAHLANPDAPAWQNMYSTAEGQQKGPGWAKQAIWGNVPTDVRAMFPGGVDSLTSKQFMDLWQHKVERTPMASAFADTRKSNMDPMQAAMASQNNEYAYAPGYDPNAGLFARLKAGGPGALFGAPNGIFPGANGQPGYNLGNRLQQAGAFLMGKPEVAAALGNDRKFVQIGTDEFGMPQYGFVNAKTGTVTPVNAAAMGGAGGASGVPNGNGLSAAIADHYNGKITREELENDPRISPTVKSNAIAMIEGTRPYPLTPKDPLAKMSVALANALAPGEDLSGRQAGVKDWATKSAELTRRANQATLHGGEMVDSFKKVGGSDFPIVNRITNFLNEQTGGAGPQALRTNVTQLASELATFVGGGQISDTRFKEWADAFPVNGSDAQKRAAMAKVSNLFTDSYKALEEKRRQAIGDRLFAKKGPLMPAEMQTALEKMRAYGEGTDNQQPTISNIRQIQ